MEDKNMKNDNRQTFVTKGVGGESSVIVLICTATMV